MCIFVVDAFVLLLCLHLKCALNLYIAEDSCVSGHVLQQMQETGHKESLKTGR